MRLAPVLVALALGVVGHAAERQWQTGTWVEVSTKRQMVDFGPGNSPFGSPSTGPQLRALADVRVFVIETEALRIEVRDTVPVGRRSIDATPGEPVTFAIEKNSVYVRDADGIEHRLRITKKSEKAAAPAAAYAAPGSGHRLREVSRDGRYVTLEDGSRWEIHPDAWRRTAAWEANASVTVSTARGDRGFDYQIVNASSDERALARYAPRR